MANFRIGTSNGPVNVEAEVLENVDGSLVLKNTTPDPDVIVATFEDGAWLWWLNVDTQ